MTVPAQAFQPPQKLLPPRISMLERAIQTHIVHDPSLAVEAKAVLDLERLSSDTASIIQIAVEFPAICGLVGLLNVAASINESEEFLEVLDELSSLPDWFLQSLPTFQAALNELRIPVLLPSAGALRQWKVRQNGKRPITVFDSLWRAAVCEANALDEFRLGMIGAGNDSRLEAARIVLERSAEAVAK